MAINITVDVTGGDLSGKNPLELGPDDTQVTWNFKDPQSRDLRVEFVDFLPADNEFPTDRVSPFTVETLHSGTVGVVDPNAPAGLYIYVVRDDQDHLFKWPIPVFLVGNTFSGRFGTVVKPDGPPNRTNS